MIHWAWLLLVWGIAGPVGFIIGAMCRVSVTADEAAQDESHSATRYGARTTAPRMRVLPEEVEERIRAEWAKAEEVEPDIEAHR